MFLRVSVATETIGAVAAEVLAAHFSRVFTCFRGRGGCRRSGRGSPGSTLFSSFSSLCGREGYRRRGSLGATNGLSGWPRKRQSKKWPRKLWQRTFLEFLRASVAAKAIGEGAAEALAAHFSEVFTCFCGRGSYRRSGRWSPGNALFPSFHVILWPRRLSEKLPRKP